MKPVTVRGRALAFPAVCVPLVARTAEALLAEVQAVARRQPDLLEWRVDFFEGLADAAKVAEVAGRLKAAAAGVPLLLTRRSVREGGRTITSTEDQVLAAYAVACASGAVDLIDWEMVDEPARVRAASDAARAHGVGVLLSFHDFGGTPPAPQLLERYRQAHSLGADVGKVAVMPRSRADVLALLQATLQASEELPIAVAGMSMGALGAVTRLAGGAFGSALTFAVGTTASAPGQLPLDELRAGLAVLQRASQG